MVTARVKYPLVLVVALVLHTSVLGAFNVADARPDLMLLVALMAGLVAGSERGALAGFAAGLAADVFLQTPLGLSALAFSIVAFAVGAMQATLLRSVVWIAPATALVGSAVAVVLYALMGAVVGQTQLLTPRIGVVIAVVALSNAVLSIPFVRIVRWSLSPLPEGAA